MQNQQIGLHDPWDSLKLLRHPADHLEGKIPLVAVLVFLIRVYQGKVTGLQGLLLPFFVDKCAAAFDYVIHVHYNNLKNQEIL